MEAALCGDRATGAGRQSACGADSSATECSPADPGDFKRGDKVSFTDRHLQSHVGVITRCNPKTASVDSDGGTWGVPYGMLRHVLDV